jgi:hypothetical protein
MVIRFSSSTAEKMSYHIIDANPEFLFYDAASFGLFLKMVIRDLLLSLASHGCQTFRALSIQNDISISELIVRLSPFINCFRASCQNCLSWHGLIAGDDVAHLFVLDRKEKFKLSIDFSVYSRNQQFRLFNCSKYGFNNPLVVSRLYPFGDGTMTSDDCIIRHSIITNTNDLALPIVMNDQNRWLAVIDSSVCSIAQRTLAYAQELFIFDHSSLLRSNTMSAVDKMTSMVIDQSLLFDSYIDRYVHFVNRLITYDAMHVGRIHSCVLGNVNRNLLFVNIVGNYRYCPKKGSHHLHNGISIIVDMSSDTFAVLCKDPDCDNRTLSWKPILF